MELAHLPIIDWDLGIKLAGNQRALAEDMLAMLLKDLASTARSIKSKHESRDYQKMQQEVHKLRGAVSYCGLPRIKSLLDQLETNLKNHIMDDLPSIVNQFDKEVSLLLEHYPLSAIES